MRNGGLIHLAESIFDFLTLEELEKISTVSTTFHKFITGKYGKKRLAKKLTTISDRSDYQMKEERIPLFVRYPRWRKICQRLEKVGTYSEFKLLITHLDEIGKIRKQRGGRWQTHDPLQIMIKRGDHEMIKILLIRLAPSTINFSDSLYTFCKPFFREEEYRYEDVWNTERQFQVMKMLLDNAERARINVNSKRYGPQKQTLMHSIVLNANDKIMTFMLDNVERYNIDLSIKDTTGKNPFAALLHSGDLRVERKMEKLKCWVKYFPKFFDIAETSAVLLSLDWYRLKEITTFIYMEVKIPSRPIANAIDKKCRIPKRTHSPIGIMSWLEDNKKHLEKETLAEFIVDYCKMKIREFKILGHFSTNSFKQGSRFRFLQSEENL